MLLINKNNSKLRSIIIEMNKLSIENGSSITKNIIIIIIKNV